MSKTEKFIVATFYKFVPLENYYDLRQSILDLCNEYEIRGTVLLALEGINATIAGSRQSVDRLMSELLKDPRFQDLEYKESVHASLPFYRMKVKLRKEIVTLGMPGTDPNFVSGTRVPAEEWDSLIIDPEVMVIDVRNKYETGIGTFKNAVSPETESFREFPEYVKQNLDPQKHKKIAMFCTGGIRCEKASSYMMQQGFENVYQLQGGILRYLEKTDAGTSLWQGECFVFDGRVAVDQALEKGEYDQCFSCRNPVSVHDKNSSSYHEGVSCPKCYDSLTPERRASLEERQRQVKLAELRHQQHIGFKKINRSDHSI